MGRALRLLLAIVVALAAVVGLLLVLQGRDRSTFQGDGTGAAAPGRQTPDQGRAHRAPPAGFRFATDPPASGPHIPVALRRLEGALSRDELLTALEAGDVVLVTGEPADLPVLRGLQEDVAGRDVALARDGQAILLDRRAGTAGVVALAWRRLLRVPRADDPRLRAFADAWLGHGAAP